MIDQHHQHQHADNVKVLPGWWHGGCLSPSPPQGEMALVVETIGIHPYMTFMFSMHICTYCTIYFHTCIPMFVPWYACICTYKYMLLQMVDLSRYTFMFVLKTQLTIGICRRIPAYNAFVHVMACFLTCWGRYSKFSTPNAYLLLWIPMCTNASDMERRIWIWKQERCGLHKTLIASISKPIYGVAFFCKES